MRTATGATRTATGAMRTETGTIRTETGAIQATHRDRRDPHPHPPHTLDNAPRRHDAPSRSC